MNLDALHSDGGRPRHYIRDIGFGLSQSGFNGNC